MQPPLIIGLMLSGLGAVLWLCLPWLEKLDGPVGEWEASWEIPEASMHVSFDSDATAPNATRTASRE